MNRIALATVFALAFAAPSAAHVVSFTFEGPFGSGSIDGSVVVDVEGGLATSGVATMHGWGINGIQRLALVTPAGSTYRSGNGTDLFGGDNRYPLDGGLVFGTNAPTSWVGGYNLGIWANTPGHAQGFASGPGLWSYTGELTIVNTIPEPSTWVLVTLGVISMAIAGWRKQRPVRSETR